MLFSGNSIAVCAFLAWGLLPLYFQFIPSANVLELLSIRILFSIPCIYLLLKAKSLPMAKIWAAMRNRRVLLICFLAGIFNLTSLYSFTWAVTNGQVLAASLGYFMNPIFSIALGVLFLKDKLSTLQSVAVALSIAGIGLQVLYYGELPWLSIIMGGTFALYGLMKKFVDLDALSIMMIELILMLPFALCLIMSDLWHQTSVLYSDDNSKILLYLLSAPVTLIPLVLFSLAVEKISLIMIGFIQYIEPSIQFLLAVMIFGEVLLPVKVASFSLIWLGLLLCIADIVFKKRMSPTTSRL
ncbi:RarD protein, DMT superfamily transporter [Shewanella halifaxensis HAW-EB4]|uniref:RarD protein, DMT superfamily transporter n=1 Tax=Shewanella halifaxensis (strain HAW-EB4) TaxID=458817 RepID=B0TN50_SHEHH|nr:EamA family transporter RarD [Shewanella halifaxensis]ABZ74762.1 RarD protein, DMT superfamily transporter [Shewanella halifaxensis HAW-EB4]